MSEWIFLALRTALALTLYIFLGWALWLLWRDLHQQQHTITAHQITPLNLGIELAGITQQQRFTTAEVIVGRDANCTCVINSNAVSAHHTRLSYHHNQWWAEDLGSTNGTLLNNEAIVEAVVLALGDQLRCGDATLTVIPESQEGSRVI